jgi:hypothetical protein
MKLLKSGYLSLYAFQLENQVTYDGLLLRKKDGATLEVPNLGFKKLMSKYLSDCEQVSEKIDNGELNKKNLDKIIDEYNSCIEMRTSAHEKIISQNAEQSKKINSWDTLEEKVKNKPDFEGKTNALEMISDIKNKIRHEEKIPNFLLEGLKTSLSKAELSQELENALKELENH